MIGIAALLRRAAAMLVIGLASLAADAQPAEMAFNPAGTGGNCIGCEWVAAEGRITSDSAAAFERFMAARRTEGTTGPAQIELNSPGGDALGAMALGWAIRATGSSTEVGRTVPDEGNQAIAPGQCAGACVLAFLGGRLRTVPDGAGAGHSSLKSDGLSLDAASLLGLDAPQLDVLATATALRAVLPNAVRGYVREMGADPAFLDQASRLLLQPEAGRLGIAASAGDTVWQMRVLRGGLALYGSGQGTAFSYTAALTCDGKRKGALLLEVAVPVQPQSGQTGPDLAASMPQNLTLQPVSGAPHPAVQAEMRPYNYVSGRLLTRVSLRGVTAERLSSEHVTISFTGATAFDGLVPAIQLDGPAVREAAALLLANCPAP